MVVLRGAAWGSSRRMGAQMRGRGRRPCTRSRSQEAAKGPRQQGSPGGQQQTVVSKEESRAWRTDHSGAEGTAPAGRTAPEAASSLAPQL